MCSPLIVQFFETVGVAPSERVHLNPYKGVTPHSHPLGLVSKALKNSGAIISFQSFLYNSATYSTMTISSLSLAGEFEQFLTQFFTKKYLL